MEFTPIELEERLLKTANPKKKIKAKYPNASPFASANIVQVVDGYNTPAGFISFKDFDLFYGDIRSYYHSLVSGKWYNTDETRSKLEKLGYSLYYREGTVTAEGSISKRGTNYGYYRTKDLSALVEITLFRPKKVVDLGSGLGEFMMDIKELANIEVHGFELDTILAKNAVIPTTQKDILTISEDDLKDADLIYFWQPLIDPDMILKFWRNLSHIKNKIVLCRPGDMIRYIRCTNINKYGGLTALTTDKIKLNP